MRKISNQIEELQTRQAQLLNRLQALKNRQSRMDRAEEARRLILAGRWLFKFCGGDASKVAKKLADANLLSSKDAKLFE